MLSSLQHRCSFARKILVPCMMKIFWELLASYPEESVVSSGSWKVNDSFLITCILYFLLITLEKTSWIDSSLNSPFPMNKLSFRNDHEVTSCIKAILEKSIIVGKKPRKGLNKVKIFSLIGIFLALISQIIRFAIMIFLWKRKKFIFLNKYVKIIV